MSDTIETPHATKMIHLTQPAVHQIRKLLEEKDLKGYSLRIFISRGGCSGFQYGMGLDNQTQEGDFEIQFEDINVLIDPVSINFLTGAIIDYHEDIMGGGFKIENPNAISSCGCGNSFKSGTSTEDVPASTKGSCCP
jgi:iron-sulfur cluster assembly accessory protein